jgi:hypothetical protein
MSEKLEKIAAKYETKIQTALLRAFDTLRVQYTIPQLTEVLDRRGITGILELYANMENVIGSAIIPQINMAITESGGAAIELIPKGAVQGALSFNIFNEKTADFIRSYQVPLVKQISNNTKETIRQSIATDLADGVNPRTTAVRFRKNIGLTAKQESYVRNFENALNWQKEIDPAIREKLRSNLNQAIQGNRYTLSDKRFKNSMNRLLNEERLPAAQIEKMVTRYRERFIRYRSEVIARTEALRATSVGNHEMLRQNVESGDIDNGILRFWDAVNDKRTRPWHNKAEAVNSKGVKYNQPFRVPNRVGTIELLMYPRDPNGSPDNTVQCRCAVFYRYKGKRS